jgi:hypothetical protein
VKASKESNEDLKSFISLVATFSNDFLSGSSCVALPVKSASIEGTWECKETGIEMLWECKEIQGEKIDGLILVSADLNDDLEPASPNLSIRTTKESPGVHCQSLGRERAVLIAPQLAVKEGTWYFEVLVTKFPLFIGWATAAVDPSKFLQNDEHHWGMVFTEKDMRIVGDFYPYSKRFVLSRSRLFKDAKGEQALGCELNFAENRIVFSFGNDGFREEIPLYFRASMKGTSLCPVMGGEFCDFDFRYKKESLKHIPRGVKHVGDVMAPVLQVHSSIQKDIKVAPHRPGSWWITVQKAQPVVLKPNVMTLIGDFEYMKWESKEVTLVKDFKDEEGEDGEIISSEDLHAMPVHVLRTLCRDRGLIASGQRQDLVERLTASYAQSKKESIEEV